MVCDVGAACAHVTGAVASVASPRLSEAAAANTFMVVPLGTSRLEKGFGRCACIYLLTA